MSRESENGYEKHQQQFSLYTFYICDTQITNTNHHFYSLFWMTTLNWLILNEFQCQIWFCFINKASIAVNEWWEFIFKKHDICWCLLLGNHNFFFIEFYPTYFIKSFVSEFCFVFRKEKNLSIIIIIIIIII